MQCFVFFLNTVVVYIYCGKKRFIRKKRSKALSACEQKQHQNPPTLSYWSKKVPCRPIKKWHLLFRAAGSFRSDGGVLRCERFETFSANLV